MLGRGAVLLFVVLFCFFVAVFLFPLINYNRLEIQIHLEKHVYKCCFVMQEIPYNRIYYCMVLNIS